MIASMPTAPSESSSPLTEVEPGSGDSGGSRRRRAQWKRLAGPAGWAAGAFAATLLAGALGLSTAKDVGPDQLLILAAASLVPAVIAFAKESKDARLKQGAQEQALSSANMIQQLQNRITTEQRAHGYTAAALGEAGKSLAALLRHHTGTDGLPRPKQTSNGEIITFSAYGSYPDSWTARHWDILKGSPDEPIAIAIAERAPPWQRGLVIDDVDAHVARESELLVLQASEPGFKSYLRAGVTIGERRFGILCVDCREPMKVTRQRRTVAAELADLLAVGLVVAATAPPPQEAA